MSIDWTELERLHTAFACTYRPITEDNPEYDRLCGALARSFPAILAERREMLAKLEAAQAKIDALMLEYCPDEMTPEQLENWGKHQRRVSPEREAEIEKALAAFDKEQK